MTAIRYAGDPDRTARRALVARALRPFVDGTAPGMASSQITEARVAATARDAAEVVLPLLGAPARSAHRVRGLIVPALVCGNTVVFKPANDTPLLGERFVELLVEAGVPAGVVNIVHGFGREVGDRLVRHPDVPEGKPAGPRANMSDAPAWTLESRDGDTVVGPAGTVGVLIRSDRRHALIVEDGRPVRAHSRCECDPARRRGRAEVAFERIAFGRRRRILDVRAGRVCPLCRAPVDG